MASYLYDIARPQLGLALREICRNDLPERLSTLAVSGPPLRDHILTQTCLGKDGGSLLTHLGEVTADYGAQCLAALLSTYIVFHEVAGAAAVEFADTKTWQIVIEFLNVTLTGRHFHA